MKTLFTRRRVSTSAIALAIMVLVLFDIGQAKRQIISESRFTLDSSFDSLIRQGRTTVSIVRSDDETLSEPVSLDTDITYAQIEEMTRKAIELGGGMDGLVKAGDIVLVKPDLVDPEPSGVGETTDVRVIKAVIRVLNEVAPGEIEFVIGEGSPRPMDYELPYSNYSSPSWTELWDVCGFQDLLTDPDMDGINFRLENLNGPWEDLVEIPIPGGGYAKCNNGTLIVHKTVLEADVHISVPVMKVHNTQVTVGLKNNIGLYPSTRYGFSKTAGVSQDGRTHKLIHYADMPEDWVEEEIVDMVLVAGIDFVVVDAVMCLQSKKAALRSSGVVTNQMRRNMILAGKDIVAVDNVAARLMGQNPDDCGHITLAEKAGLGVNDISRIDIVGASLVDSAIRFKKDTYFTSDYGQSGRVWLIAGPFDGSTDGAMDETVDIPKAGEGGWTQPVYFFDDRIDLGSFLGSPSGKQVAYAFTYFTAPKEQTAEFWIGSDEAMRIYMNGEIIYDYTGIRAYDKQTIVAEKFTATLAAGENTLLVKVYNNSGRFDFALNICEPEADSNYDGDRVAGLTFHTESTVTGVDSRAADAAPSAPVLYQNHPNPFNGMTTLSFLVPDVDDGADVSLVVYDILGRKVRTLTDRHYQPGMQVTVWDARDEAGSSVATGMYLARLEAGGASAVKKLMYVR